MAVTQIKGYTTANIAEVEAATKALRVTMRAEDYGALGIYCSGGSSATMPAGGAANSPIIAFRWTHATNLALIKRMTISAGNTATAFTAGVVLANLFVARSWSVSDTGGTSILPTGNVGKLRTSGMGTSLFGDARIGSTGVLTAGTRTKDANPVGSIAQSVVAVAGSVLLPPYPIFEARPGEHPIVLAQNEGIVLELTVPATGTYSYSFQLLWSELTAY